MKAEGILLVEGNRVRYGVVGRDRVGQHQVGGQVSSGDGDDSDARPVAVRVLGAFRLWRALCLGSVPGGCYRRSMGRQFRLVVSAWVLFSSACGTSSEEEGKFSDAQGFLRDFAQAVCSSLARCCEHQSYELDLTQCKRSLEADLAHELAEYEGLQVRFDAAAAELCIVDYANAACLEQPSEDYDVKRHCSLMFKGLIAPGGACRDNDECRVDDGRRAQCLDGVCTLDSEPAAPAARGVAGAPCGSTCATSGGDSSACEPAFAAFNDPPADSSLPACFTSDGLHCAGGTGARTCQPLIAEGGSCAGSSQGCAAGTFCDLETRVCQAQTDSGACGPERDACSANAACDFEVGRCVLVGSRNGARCEQDGDCSSGYCNPSSVCQHPLSASVCSQPELN